MNKDIEVFGDLVTVGPEAAVKEFQITANLYEKVPNGGVVVLRITELPLGEAGHEAAALEKLLFLEPPS